MGYTHYWYRNEQPEPADAYGKLALDTIKIIEACEARGIKFGDGHGDNPFDRGRDITEGLMSWNGFADEAYETFWWPAGHKVEDPIEGVPEGFTFCKTRGDMPYDIAVCATLIRAKVHYGDTIRVSSDGDWDSEWKDAAALCTELFGEVKNPMA